MSKMSEIAMELDDQATELGFENYEEALAKGYKVDYDKYKLVKRGLGYSETVEYLAKEQEKAHEEWLKERDTLLKNLEEQEKFARESYEVDHTVIRSAIEFIRKGEM